MKIFNYHNRTEGSDIPTDSLLVFGRNIESNNFNGVYIVFNSPKYYINEYVDSDSFEHITGRCSDRYMFMIRRCSNNKWTSILNWCVSPQ